MKILHFSDIHIGKKLAGNDMSGEYRAILDEVASVADAHGAELVVASGDLIERGADNKSESALISALLKLSNNGRRAVFCLAGRCDDKERLAVLKDALAASGVYIITDVNEKIVSGGKIADSGKGWAVAEGANGETACVAYLPYFEEGADYKTQTLKYIETACKNFSEKHLNIFAAYIGMDDAECDDGRPALTRGVLPENADYTALGGCHKTQLLDHGRSVIYSGSLLGDSFEETKNKDKNAKKIIVAKIEKGKDAEKAVIKLAASKPLIKLTGTSAEQILTQLPETEGCLVSINLNVSAPLSIVEYKSLKAAHPGVVNITLNMPPKVIKERYRVLRAGSANEMFRNFYRTKHNAEPPRPVVTAFAELAKNIEYNINSDARLDKAELKNVLKSGGRSSEILAKIFHADELRQSVLVEINRAEAAAQREYEEVAEVGEYTDELAATEEEIALAKAQLNRAAVAKGLLPEFEKAVTLEKEFKAGEARLAAMKARQKKFTDVFAAEEKLKAADAEIAATKKAVAEADAGYGKTLAELRVLENELAAAERTIDMQLRGIERPFASPETITWLSQAVLQEETIRIYRESTVALERRMASAEKAAETSQRNLAAYQKAAQDIKAATEETRKNLIALAPGETEIEGVFAALQKNHSEIETGIKRAKEITAEIKALIAENETETEKLKTALEGVSEKARQKKQQADLILGTEHRLEKLYRQKEEQLGLNVFTQIANNTKEKDTCPLCGEIVRRNPSFGEISPGTLDNDIADAKEQLREAYDHRDELSLVLREKEQLRDKSKQRLEEIIEKLKTLKAEKAEIMRGEGDDDRRAVERAAAATQSINRAKSLFKTLEERRAALAAAEKRTAEETGALAKLRETLASLKEQHNELSTLTADAVFAYSKLKNAIGRDDLRRVEAEMTEDIKRRGQTIQSVIAHEGTRIQTLNRLRKLEKALNETEAKQAAAEEKLKTLNETREGLLEISKLWSELEREVRETIEAQQKAENAVRDQKNLCISAMIAGDFKNVQEIKKAVAYDVTAGLTIKTLEDRRKKLTKLISEATAHAEALKEDSPAAALTEIKNLFAGKDFYKIIAEEYFADTAFSASEKLAKATGGRYNIEYADGFVTVDNFAGGRQEKITELTDILTEVFEL